MRILILITFAIFASHCIAGDKKDWSLDANICNKLPRHGGPAAVLLDGDGNFSKGPASIAPIRVSKNFVGEGIQLPTGYLVLSSQNISPDNIDTNGFAVNLRREKTVCKNAILFSVIFTQNYKGNGTRPYKIEEPFPNMIPDENDIDATHSYKFDARLITTLTE